MSAGSHAGAVRCDTCRRAIPDEDVELALRVAKCTECDSVFRVERPLPEAAVPARRAGARGEDAAEDTAEEGTELAPLPPPPGCQVTRGEGRLEVTVPWRGTVGWFFVLFAAIWDSIVGIFVVVALVTGQYEILLFASIHILVGIGVTYAALVNLVNRSVIRVERGKLTISHGPLPAPGGREIPAAQLNQLYVKKETTFHKGHSRDSYLLMAVLTSGEHEQLLWGFETADQALWFEEEIEVALGIEDAAVDGEMP